LKLLLIILIKTIQGKEESDRTFTQHDKKANDCIHSLTMNISTLQTCRNISVLTNVVGRWGDWLLDNIVLKKDKEAACWEARCLRGRGPLYSLTQHKNMNINKKKSGSYY
jgi:hypothetical protein